MTLRERMLAALHFTRPDRLPRDVWGERYISLYRPDDWRHLTGIINVSRETLIIAIT